MRIFFAAAEDGGSLFEKLGLHPMEMFFYAITLVILVGGLYLLLFRPIKKMVKKRRETLAAIYNENEKLNREALDLKREYQQNLERTKQEALEASEKAARAAESKSFEILAAAHAKADEIVTSAVKEAELEKKRVNKEFKREVCYVAVEIAEGILEREIKQEDNDKIIEEALKRWER